MDKLDYLKSELMSIMTDYLDRIDQAAEEKIKGIREEITANKLITYKTKEAASLLGVNTQLLCNMAKNKIIPAVKIGQGWIFRQEVIKEFIIKGEKGG